MSTSKSQFFVCGPDGFTRQKLGAIRVLGNPNLSFQYLNLGNRVLIHTGIQDKRGFCQYVCFGFSPEGNLMVLNHQINVTAAGQWQKNGNFGPAYLVIVPEVVNSYRCNGYYDGCFVPMLYLKLYLLRKPITDSNELKWEDIMWNLDGKTVQVTEDGIIQTGFPFGLNDQHTRLFQGLPSELASNPPAI